MKKISALLAIALALNASRSALPEALSLPTLGIAEYRIFTGEVETFAHLAGLTLLLLVVSFAAPAQDSKNEEVRRWRRGFLTLFLAVVLLTAFANPQGRYPWNRRDVYIEIETRAAKPLLYQKLPAPPDALIAGSSVSFLMPMEAFQSRWGLSGFNFSVNGGSVADFANMIRTVRRLKPEKIPAVVVVEISNLKLASPGTSLTPLDYIQDMGTRNQQAEALAQLFKDAYRVRSLADALFTLTIVDAGRWDSPMKLQADGTFVLTQEEGEKKYARRIKNNIPVLDEMKFCDALDEEGKRDVEDLIALSRQYQFSLVIYAPPINDDFYQWTGYPKSRHDPCLKLFDEFMNAAAAQNDNVFFKDLSRYEAIASRGMELYRDTHHLKAEGQQILLDALAEDVESAIRWAQAHRRLAR